MTADSAAAGAEDTIATLRRMLAEREAERDAALAREAAMAEVLAVINRSPGDPQPVFDMILEKAHVLCGATSGTLALFDGTHFVGVAAHGQHPDQIARMRQPFLPTPRQQQMIDGVRFVHVEDLRAIARDALGVTARLSADLTGVRTVLGVPLRKDGAFLGFISANRTEVRPFSDVEIALLESFAAQAVIAMENARLLGELRERTAELAERNIAFAERIDHQAATIDVLQAMSASPGDAQPVLEAIARRARLFCEADVAGVALLEEGALHLRAHAGFTGEVARNYEGAFPRPVDHSTVMGRAILTRDAVYIPDFMADPEYALKNVGSASTMRSNAAVPLLRHGVPIGAITIGRFALGAYSDAQMNLLKTFAEQAVIAITSAETYRALQTRTADLQESLEYQTATSDVLKVISRSTFDLQPVLQTLLSAAARLCDAENGGIATVEGDGVRVAAHYSPDGSFRASSLGQLLPLNRATIVGRTVLEGRVVHVEDVAADPEHVNPALELQGLHSTMLGVPLLRDGAAIGSIRLGRNGVRPFTDRQIELVSTFADQAVIAIENTRLLTEQREALEQQTATAEVLGVINASPGDLAPVFDAILEKAMRLCGAAFGHMSTWDGERVHTVASRGLPPAFAAYMASRGPTTALTPVVRQILETKRPMRVADVRDGEGYRNGHPVSRAVADLGGARSVLHVPLLKDETFVGYLTVYRQEQRPYSDKEVALLENFAAQAVIAMENARLLGELRERTAELAERNDAFAERIDHQAATIDVLKEMSASPGDPQPVFDLIVRQAQELCGSRNAALFEYDGTMAHLRARLYTGDWTEADEAFRRRFPRPMTRDPDLAVNTAILEGRIVHIRDADQEPGFPPESRAAGIRSGVMIPIMREGTAVGSIGMTNDVPGGFSDTQVELLKTFAEQAAIAITSAETYRALQTRTADLREALEYQTATSDVLKVISQAAFDLQPVFDTIVRTAARLCDADFANVANRDGDEYRILATFTNSPDFDVLMPKGRALPVSGESLSGRAVLSGQIVHVANILTDPDYNREATEALRRVGVGTIMTVPLLRDGTAIGTLSLGRRRVQLFTAAQVDLIRTFADQAVIAIENTRLLTEQREALEQQTATAEVLGVINANPGNLAPVFDAILEKAMRLCGVAFGTMTIRDGSQVRHAARRGHAPALEAFLANRPPWTVTPGSMPSRMFSERKTLTVLDLRNDSDFQTGNPITRALVELGGARSFLVTPLLKDNETLGYFAFYRQEVRAFSDKEVALLENFAAQAVIAMENARLLGELRAALETTQTTLRDLKIAQANLIQAEKMASLGQLTAGIAHEIKNPLNFVNNFAALSVDLLEEFKETAGPAIALLTNDQRADIDDVSAMLTTNLQKIVEHGKRADGIVKAMLEHSRGSSGERREVDLNALVDEALNLAYHGARAQDQNFNITLERDFAPGIAPIELNPQDMTRVFLNMFTNGFYAANKRAKDGAEPEFEPVLKISTRAVGDTVEIRIRDNGTGIAPNIRDKLFQPFFTTKPTGEGTGLGLSITYDIVTKAHGGTIAVDSEVGAFTEFVVNLPRHMFVGEGGRS